MAYTEITVKLSDADKRWLVNWYNYKLALASPLKKFELLEQLIDTVEDELSHAASQHHNHAEIRRELARIQELVREFESV